MADRKALQEQGIPKSIIKDVLPPTSKQINKDEKHEKELKKRDRYLLTASSHDVTTQVECPNDLDKINCGSHCWKDGHLWEVKCAPSEKHKTTTKKPPSLTGPPHFPGSVTVTPGDAPIYPSPDEPTHAYEPSPGEDIPPLELAPGQEPIQPTIPGTAPGRAPTPSAPPQHITMPTPTGPGRAVGRSSPSTGKYHGETINPNGCYHGNLSSGTAITCRAGIGTGPSKRPVYEAGNQKIPVSDLLGGSRNFHLIYHFHLGQPEKGGGMSTEVTAGYDGSSSDETATGITIGIRDNNGDVMVRTEDHNDSHKVPGEYRALCKQGDGSSCGGVSYIPEFRTKNGAYGQDFDIIWVGSQVPGGVNYKGYLRVTKTGNIYLIANLNNPRTGGYPGGEHYAGSPGNVINYATQDNFFARGRTNKSGMDATISGILYADDDNTYVPPGNIITTDSQLQSHYYYQGPEGYYYSGRPVTYRSGLGYI